VRRLDCALATPAYRVPEAVIAPEELPIDDESRRAEDAEVLSNSRFRHQGGLCVGRAG